MPAQWPDILIRLASTGSRIRLMCAGAASLRSVTQLLPATVQTLIEVTFIPDASSWEADYGSIPEKFCSPETALSLATTAFRKTLCNANAQPEKVIGVSCVVGDDRQTEKPSSRRCFVAMQTFDSTQLLSVMHHDVALSTENVPRFAEEMIGLVLGVVCDGEDVRSQPQFGPDRLMFEKAQPDQLLIDVWNRTTTMAWSSPEGILSTESHSAPLGILSGAFNPLHQGHISLRAAAEGWLRERVCFELPILNAEKPPLDYLTIAHRRRQFQEHSLVLTAAPTFSEKAEIFPGATFVVGFDTAERVVQPRYYRGSTELMRSSLERIRQRGCRFLVAGRLTGKRFLTLGEIALPAGYEELFVELPSSSFRHDISSSEQRRAASC